MIGIKKTEPMTTFTLLRLRSAAAAAYKGVGISLRVPRFAPSPSHLSLTLPLAFDAHPQLSYISKTFCQRHKTKRASIAPLSKLPNRIKDKPRSEKRSLEWSVRLKSYQVACVYFPCCCCSFRSSKI